MAITRRSARCRGTTVIEFALIVFLFFLVMWGFFEFARAFYVVNSTQHLTRCIARAAVVLKPSQHEEAKELRSSDGQQCLTSGGHWPFFTLTPTDLRGAFRLSYGMVMSPGGTPTPVLDTDIGSSTAYDDQLSACTQQTNCVVNVTAYFDAENNPVPMLGLLAAWIGTGSTFKGYEARTTMPAESMGWRP